MSYNLKGTDVKAITLEAAIRFGIAQDLMIVKILKRDLPPERLADLEREAAEMVLASGQFERIRTEHEHPRPE